MTHPSLQGLEYKTKSKAKKEVVRPQVKPEAYSKAEAMKLINEALGKQKSPKITLPNFEAMIQRIVDEKISKFAKVDKEEDKKLKIEDIDGVDRLIRNVKAGIDQRWHGSGNIVQYADLSASLNGITQTFTITGALSSSRIIAVHYSSFPFILQPTTDWTFNSTTKQITFLTLAPAAGQTLIIIYAK